MDPRSFDTIYLPSNTLKSIKKEFDTFIEKEKLYREYQIPYKKGILFYGPPGTGKTSLVKSLAYEYQLNIYIININDDDINDDSIVDILNSIGNNSNKILLFEDVDSAFADKEVLSVQSKILDIKSNSLNIKNNIKNNNIESNISNTVNDIKNNKSNDDIENIQYNDKLESEDTMSVRKRKFLTYSGLLNALDGVLSNQNGVITIMTTNYLHKLGDAFLRPGRIDRMFELKECNDEQIELMIKTFINKRANVFKDIEKVTINQEKLDDNIKSFIKNLTNENGMSTIKPCELQYYILKYIDNIDDIFNNYRELSCFKK